MTRRALLLLAALVTLALTGCRTYFQRPADLMALPVPPLQMAVTEEAFGGKLPAQLEEYVRQWGVLMEEAPRYEANEEVTFALPPAKAQLAFPLKEYQKSFARLLHVMADGNLSHKQHQFLELLSLYHQQQYILAGVYHAADGVQHGKADALPELLKYARHLDDFLYEYYGVLPRGTANLVSEALADWLKLWTHQHHTLGVLPTLWLPSRSSDFPAESTASPVHFSAFYEELPLVPPFEDAPVIWLHQEFELPVVAANRSAWLILPSMSRNAKVLLEGREYAPRKPGRPFAIKLDDSVGLPGDKLRIAVGFPPSALGRPYLPPCLASAPE